MPPAEAGVKRRRGRPSFQEVVARQASQGITDGAVVSLTSRLPTLEQETKHISPDVVNAKWVNLTKPAQEQVRGLLKAVERPVFMRYRDEDKRAEAQSAVDSLLQDVERKLPRFPFPPDTKDGHFDYEKLLEGNRSLEAQLTPAIHSINLLREAVQQEEASLDADRRKLEALERDVRAKEDLRRRQTKNVHPLLDLQNDPETTDDDAESIGLIDHAAGTPFLVHSLVDSNLAPVIEELELHVDGLQEEFARAHELDDAVSATRAAVDDLLYRKVRAGQYARIHGVAASK